MGIYRRLKSSFLISALLVCSHAFAAPITKTVTMPSASSLFSSGSAVLNTGQLTVSTVVGEYIPAAASESRALASISKGITVPTSGIVSTLKSGLKANAASLALSAAVAAAVAGVDWLMTDGILTKKVDGDVLVYDPTGDYYYWQVAGQTSRPKSSSARGACPATDNFNEAYPAAPLTSVVMLSESSAQCKYTASYEYSGYVVGRYGSTCPSGSTYSATQYGCIGSGSYVPVTDTDYSVLDGFVQGKDGVWQQGLVEDLCSGSTNFEQCVSDMGGTPKLSGPSTVTSTPVTTSTTTTNPDGTQTVTATTSKTDYQLAYPGGAVVDITPTTTSSTTTTQKDSTGATTSTSTSTTAVTTTATTPTTTTSDGTYTDTDFPDVPPFYDQKYPNGFKGVWDDNKDALTNSPFITFLKGFVPSFSGTCPTFGLSFDIMPHANYGYVQFSSLCYIFDFVKIIILVTAMFTCRALIFGG